MSFTISRTHPHDKKNLKNECNKGLRGTEIPSPNGTSCVLGIV